MLAFEELIKRNMRIYIRDKGAVLFSLLSMAIVLGLMLFFLGDMNIDGLTGALSQIPGRDFEKDKENARLLVTLWTCAGIIAINAPNVTLAVYSAMIKDKSSGRLGSIYTAPIPRMTLACSYVVAAWICSVIVCVVSLVLSEIYCVFQGGIIFSLEEHIKLLLMIGANSFVYASLMYLAATLIKTEGAWSGVGTVVGTLVGFLGAIYIPIGSLSKEIGGLLKCTPVLYGTKMFRSIMTKDVLNKIFMELPVSSKNQYMEEMGMQLECFGKNVSNITCMLILLICGMMFLMLGAAVTRKNQKYDR